MNQAGKSLVEVMVVMGIIGLGVVLAGEGFLGAAARNQGMAIRAEIASELRIARHMASTSRERIRVWFEPQGTSIRTERLDVPSSMVRQYDFSGKGIVVEDLSNGPSVVFYPSGRTATPTTITLRNDRNGDVKKLTVSITGRVSFK